MWQWFSRHIIRSQPTYSTVQCIVSRAIVFLHLCISFTGSWNSFMVFFNFSTCSEYMLCSFDFISPFFCFPLAAWIKTRSYPWKYSLNGLNFWWKRLLSLHSDIYLLRTPVCSLEIKYMRATQFHLTKAISLRAIKHYNDLQWPIVMGRRLCEHFYKQFSELLNLFPTKKCWYPHNFTTYKWQPFSGSSPLKGRKLQCNFIILLCFRFTNQINGGMWTLILILIYHFSNDQQENGL